MKHMKRVLSIVLAMTMVLAMGMTAYATGGDPAPAPAAATSQIVVKGNDNLSLEDQTIEAYKIFSMEHVGDAYNYEITSKWENFLPAAATALGITFEANATTAAKTVAVTEALAEANAEKTAAFFEAARVYAAQNSVTPDVTSFTYNASNNTATANVEPGYYLINAHGIDDEGNVVTSAVIVQDSEKAEVQIKADVPSDDKNIVESEDELNEDLGVAAASDLVKENDRSIGDIVTYELSSATPSTFKGYDPEKGYWFAFVDTLSKGLTYKGNVKVYVDGVDKTDDVTIKFNPTQDATTKVWTGTQLNPEGQANTIRFEFDPIKFMAYGESKSIKIYYQVELNKDCIVGEDGNPNDSHIEFDRNPYDEGAGTPKGVKGETPDKTVRTYTTEFNVWKYTTDGTTEKSLAGAKFKLTGTSLNKVLVDGSRYVEDANGEYYGLNDGTFTKEAPTTATQDQYDGKTYKLEAYQDQLVEAKTVEVVAVTGADGKVTFTGLEAGEYTLEEIEAPSGYNKIEGEIKVYVVGIYDQDGAKGCTWHILTENKTPEQLANMTAEQIAAITWNGTAKTPATATVPVLNQTGAKLPETGGIGTTIFYIVGAMLAIGAAVVLVTKKRMNA